MRSPTWVTPTFWPVNTSLRFGFCPLKQMRAASDGNRRNVNQLAPKWSFKLAAFDVYIWDQCFATEHSLRID